MDVIYNVYVKTRSVLILFEKSEWFLCVVGFKTKLGFRGF